MGTCTHPRVIAVSKKDKSSNNKKKNDKSSNKKKNWKRKMIMMMGKWIKIGYLLRSSDQRSFRW